MTILHAALGGMLGGTGLHAWRDRAARGEVAERAVAQACVGKEQSPRPVSRKSSRPGLCRERAVAQACVEKEQSPRPVLRRTSHRPVPIICNYEDQGSVYACVSYHCSKCRLAPATMAIAATAMDGWICPPRVRERCASPAAPNRCRHRDSPPTSAEQKRSSAAPIKRYGP